MRPLRPISGLNFAGPSIQVMKASASQTLGHSIGRTFYHWRTEIRLAQLHIQPGRWAAEDNLLLHILS
jgi:hypothetical protein